MFPIIGNKSATKGGEAEERDERYDAELCQQAARDRGPVWMTLQSSHMSDRCCVW